MIVDLNFQKETKNVLLRLVQTSHWLSPLQENRKVSYYLQRPRPLPVNEAKVRLCWQQKTRISDSISGANLSRSKRLEFRIMFWQKSFKFLVTESTVPSFLPCKADLTIMSSPESPSPWSKPKSRNLKVTREPFLFLTSESFYFVTDFHFSKNNNSLWNGFATDSVQAEKLACWNLVYILSSLAKRSNLFLLDRNQTTETKLGAF